MNILIADDDFPIRDWLANCCKAILGDECTEIRTVGNGYVALNEVKLKKADVLFADIKMPVMDGLELIKQVRRLDMDIYIVILSSYDDFNYARTAFQNKVNEYVLKTEITMEYMKNILNRARLYLSNGNKSKSALELFSLEQIMKGWNNNFSKQEKCEFLAQYNIKMPVDPFFCVANLNRNKKYASLRMIQCENIYKVFSIRAEEAEVTCFAISGEKSLLYQFQKVNMFVKQLAGMNEEHILCYGAIGNDAENILNYVINVYRGLNYRYYDNIQVICEETIKDYIRKYDNIDPEIYAGFMEIIDLNDKNMDKAREKLVNWFQMLDDRKVLNISWIKYMCYQLNGLKNTGKNGIDIRNKPEKRISESTSLDQLKESVLEGYTDKTIEIKTKSKVIKNALKYIYSNYSTITGLSEVADHVGLSSEYLSRLFKKETGVNFSVFLNEYKLDQAKELLLSTDMKLYEIVQETGFSSLSYFSRKFKEKFDKTPFEYRK